ncbi:MAG: ABC transporter ATP-binding protein [Clostridia bacterium]|nr:ABC transporter ATP-binding protein [Clostridia bacterium]
MKQKKKRNAGLITKFLPYYKPYIGIMSFDMFCAALTTVCELVLPMVVRTITNAASGEDLSALTPTLILGIGGMYVLLRIIDTAANYFMTSIGHIMGTKIETDMRRDLFSHLQKLSFSYYDNTKVGTLMSRMTTDLFDVTEFAHHCPEEFFIAGVKIIGAFILLCTINVPLTLIIFSVIPLILAFSIFFRRRMRSNFRESRKQIGELNSQIEDSLLGVRVTRSFAREDEEKRKFGEGNCEYLRIKSERYRIMGAFHSSTRLFDGLMYIIVVVAGALFMMGIGNLPTITPPDYIAYLMFVSTLLTSIRRIVEFSEQFQQGISGIERFQEIMETEPEIQDAPNATELCDVKGRVEFCDVSFHYETETKNVLTHLDLKVAPGENIALVGPSGGVTTTLCSLSPRFYEVSSGKILVDGKDIREVTLHSLRSCIGVVAQDVYLFSGSVRENIAYGKVDATDEEIEAAARMAGAHEFISTLPDGYNTYVGERGVKLSGGQKQRISIARLFLKNPPILILDEATSALDNESERLVQQSLEKLAEGRTTFTIAHRLTTIRNADRILVLTENGIEESGTHQELIAKGGIYSELYALYSTL